MLPLTPLQQGCCSTPVPRRPTTTTSTPSSWSSPSPAHLSHSGCAPPLTR
ncbi:hypothetical protein I553_8933 [Mycobacterium xenopi 4042]|uniref:Uncharacterized protein n=1 Tax=Mycobacterium xenopi 4042 TaxID=1299334 RepID=X8CLC1_MYCXE|nr:hypothetical protein I553_8933 [Mycobacterium xenopi 4042]